MTDTIQLAMETLVRDMAKMPVVSERPHGAFFQKARDIVAELDRSAQMEADVSIAREAVRQAEGYASEVEEGQTSPAVYGQYVALAAIKIVRETLS